MEVQLESFWKDLLLPVAAGECSGFDQGYAFRGLRASKFHGNQALGRNSV